ncbi:MAG: hypothetical protein Q9175_000351 [Cornicularia normoerica]
MGHESSPGPPTDQADPTRSSTSIAQSWTTPDSNLALLECLSIATPTRPALPTELILQILDHPTRWVYLYSIRHPPSVHPNRPIVMIANRPTGIPLLFTRPFSARDSGRLRQIVFTFRSRDQGWSSNPDNGSWSWFEASLARLPSTDEDGQGGFNGTAQWTGSYEWTGEWMKLHEKRLENGPRYRIQTNKHASTEPEEYTIELTDEHELVQRVNEGDRVVLWACACFPGWENRVYEAEITVLGTDDITTARQSDDH